MEDREYQPGFRKVKIVASASIPTFEEEINGLLDQVREDGLFVDCIDYEPVFTPGGVLLTAMLTYSQLLEEE